MAKLNITLDVSKITKSKIVDKNYTNSAGEQVIKKEYRIEACELKEPKVIKKTDTYELVKTHTIIESQTPEEKENKVKVIYVGEGITFYEVKPQVKTDFENKNEFYPQEEINADDIPF